ncbi:hypothetical protein JJB07_18470 [Tumebacillus sp. ITR2]|uniref:Uncharacterized protein n=1 Tax=Tumebacillus amylolyticus TaxID=2801339 RepID=A0ABS1JEC5_9BACL|nr:hypothetical protein [Tumebacillus amylolyticus]MBL0388593.1 hypothetical protein [Tumebacillus amylolyticus]
MKEFIEKFKKATFENDVYLVPAKILEEQDSLLIHFQVFLVDTTDLVQEWKVTCSETIDYQHNFEYIEDLNVYQDHVLLWKANQEQAQLFFKGTPQNTNELVGELYIKHQEVTQGWIPFGTFLNGPLEWLIKGGDGLLASGPLPLLQVYQTVLNSFGISTSLLSKGKTHQPYQVLVFATSYVVAKEFQFEMMAIDKRN